MGVVKELWDILKDIKEWANGQSFEGHKRDIFDEFIETPDSVRSEQ